MTNRQKQWQLYYLGYLPDQDEIDGIIGPVTKAATEAFQKAVGIKADGVFGTHTRNKSKEIISDVQEVLKALVDKSIKVDGLAGPKTMDATVKYQKLRGLPQTGIADAATLIMVQQDAPEPEEVVTDKNVSGTFWDEIKYFTREELKCKCGGRYCNGYPAEPQELLVRLAERAREHFGKPAHVTSCLRCRQHNANEGGVANSRHMYGKAMDLYIEGVTGNDLYSWFKKQPEVRYTYKVNDRVVHFDIQ